MPILATHRNEQLHATLSRVVTTHYTNAGNIPLENRYVNKKVKELKSFFEAVSPYAAVCSDVPKK